MPRCNASSYLELVAQQFSPLSLVYSTSPGPPFPTPSNNTSTNIIAGPQATGNTSDERSRPCLSKAGA